MSRIEELLERATVALEAMAKDPVIEFEAAPPVCPNCSKFNPTVHVRSDDSGPIAECVMIAECDTCHHRFYAVPIAWHMFLTLEEVKVELERRAEQYSNGSQRTN
jgi:hypothetical protein